MPKRTDIESILIIGAGQLLAKLVSLTMQVRKHARLCERKVIA